MSNPYIRLNDAVEEFIEEECDLEQFLVIAGVEAVIKLSRMCEQLLVKLEQKYGDEAA